MNMYDEAYALAKAIRECDEMKRLKKAEAEIRGDEEALKMVREYITEQAKADYARMAGQKASEETTKRLQELAVLVSNNAHAQEYLQAFIRWNQAGNEIQQIVYKALAEGLSILEPEKK
jgi:cell fate (sporulation/competence/biofilm development) regulator YlbF (YheA/YmcA/DUF963 family)